MNKKTIKKTTIYYDGDCSMCTAIITKIKNDKKDFFTTDIQSEKLPEQLTEAEAQKEINVIGSDGTIYKNVDALLKIIEEYPKLQFFKKIASYPLLKKILSVGYRIVSSHRHLLFGNMKRIFLLKIVTVLGILSGILLSLPLWQNERLFPKIPALQFLNNIPTIVPDSIFYILTATLLATLLFPRPQKVIAVSLLCVSLLVFFDLTRLQPWLYQYFFMLSALVLFTWKQKDTEQNVILLVSRIIIASLYIYGGLQKLNSIYVYEVFPWILEPLINIIPQLTAITLYLAILTPLIEIGIGISLLSKKLRNFGVIAATCMSIFVLAMIGPYGHNWNSIVWPWNITMIALVFTLFWNTKSIDIFTATSFKKYSVIHKVILILFSIMPFLSFFNMWDSYLSASLYSGTIKEAEITVSKKLQKKLPTELQKYTRQTTTKHLFYFDVRAWSEESLGVPLYPELKSFETIFYYLCNYTVNTDDIFMTVYEKKILMTGIKKTYYQCNY